MKSEHIEKIQKEGHRITQARSAIVDLLENTATPISTKALHTMLSRIGIQTNITTVYRELEFLVELNIVEKVPLKDTELYYEIKGRPHHHHLVCTSCGNIEDISLKTESMLLEEAHAVSSYRIQHHSLTFYGQCPQCQH